MEILAPSLTVFEKIQIGDEKNLLIQGLPSTIEKQFSKLSFSKNITPLLKIKKIDLALIFAINHRQLEDILREVVPALHPDAKVWIAYPKVSSKIVSDLSRDANWQCIAAHAFECVRSIELDNVWCAMRFQKMNVVVPKKKIVEEGAIATSSAFIPAELEILFNKYPNAKSFFKQLPVSNQKEYSLWINGAKKEVTRISRLQTAIHKLTEGKKTPTEK